MERDREGLLRALADQVHICLECRLAESRRLAVVGEGPLDAELLWVGEAPGAAEDRAGRPFVGASGRFLRREMEAAGLDPARMYITNVVKCRPPGNRKPRPDEIAICTALYLVRQVDLIAPRALVALGATAAEALLAGEVRMTAEHGTWRHDGDLSRRPLPVFITYHPAAALRNERWREEMRADLRKLAESRERVAYGR